MLIFGRNQHNIVKQVFFPSIKNKYLKKKKKVKASNGIRKKY